MHFLILAVLASTKSQQDVMITGHSSDPDSQTEPCGYGNPALSLPEEIIDKGCRRYNR